MQTHRFCVNVECKTKPHQGWSTAQDSGFILLPDSYSMGGAPTRLVISCHGAGGTVTTDDSQVEHQTLTEYLVANGYAVMDVGGLPASFAQTEGIDPNNNIGAPIAVDCYVAAYHYCMAHFNLCKEVCVHGASMGGISSTNLVRSGRVPVIAHSAFCPVLDTYQQIYLHPWSGGLPKTALGKLYDLTEDENGEYIYDESKIGAFNPAANPVPYPVPVKFWHCEDDPVVDIAVTRSFVNRIREAGGRAELVTFPTGGHEPQLVGPVLQNPRGNTRVGDKTLFITPAVEGVFDWINQGGK